MNNIWKYLEYIPTINKDKFEQRLTKTYIQYHAALKVMKECKGDRKLFKKEIKKLDVGQFIYMLDFENKNNNRNIGFTGTYKDAFDQVHVIQFNGLYFYKKFIQYLRSGCQKRIGVGCRDIIVDNKSIIDRHGNFVEPLYMQRQRNFVREVGLHNDNN